jgi:flagellar capping protein FliD
LTTEASEELKSVATKINDKSEDILAIQTKLLSRYELLAPKLTKYNAIIERM